MLREAFGDLLPECGEEAWEEGVWGADWGMVSGELRGGVMDLLFSSGFVLLAALEEECGGEDFWGA